MSENKEPILLISLSDDIQVALVKEMLRDNDIPTLVRDHLLGGYMKVVMGFSGFYKDIYVSEDNYKAAKEIIDVYFTEDFEVEE